MGGGKWGVDVRLFYAKIPACLAIYGLTSSPDLVEGVVLSSVTT